MFHTLLCSLIFSISREISITYRGIYFEKFCNIAIRFIFVIISAWFRNKVMTWQFELLLWMKPEALFQWMNLWCDIELNVVIRLFTESEIYSPYSGTFDTFWFPFYCDSEHLMKFERVLVQFLVRSEERLLQNISKWLLP